MARSRTRGSGDRWAVRPWHGSLMILAATATLLGASPGRGAEKLVIADKTLVAWVAPADLTQRGGSVLTIEKTGGVFDAIVFGELAASKWMPGSDGFRRTQQEQSSFPTETADNQTLVQVAIVYKDQQITLYRNGSQYAEYTAAGAERFSGDSLVLLGLRHLDANPDNRFFTGSIEDARIYGCALNAEQIAALKPNQPSDPEPLGVVGLREWHGRGPDEALAHEHALRRHADRRRSTPPRQERRVPDGDQGRTAGYSRPQQRRQRGACTAGETAQRPLPAGLPLRHAGRALHAL